MCFSSAPSGPTAAATPPPPAPPPLAPQREQVTREQADYASKTAKKKRQANLSKTVLTSTPLGAGAPALGSTAPAKTLLGQ